MLFRQQRDARRLILKVHIVHPLHLLSKLLVFSSVSRNLAYVRRIASSLTDSRHLLCCECGSNRTLSLETACARAMCNIVAYCTNWTKLIWTSWPSYTKSTKALINHEQVKRHDTPTYFVLFGCRHCSELGRIVLNTCIPVELFMQEFANSSLCDVIEASQTEVRCDKHNFTCSQWQLWKRLQH